MTRFKTEDILKATGGTLLQTGPKGFSGISTDSRKIEKGELFVPLVGERFDGHNFVDAALDRGAAGCIVNRGRVVSAPEGRAVVEVVDSLRALQNIAHSVRAGRTGLLVAGVTGTNGKTTTKEMLASILERRGPVLKNQGNLNNEIGVPLTLLRLDKADWAAVIEMGMSGFGEIERLAEIAAPSIGVITNIGPGHLEQLGSMEGVARAKGELIAGLPAAGTAVLNSDDPYLHKLIESQAGRVVTFGLDPGADFTACNIEETGGSVSFKMKTPEGTATVRLPLMGAHNVYNALAAAAAARCAGMTLSETVSGLEEFRPVKMRMEIMEIDGARVINDAYNANPASMAAALTTLAAVKDGRRVAVLGDMLELGTSADKSHYDLGRLAGSAGLACLIVMGASAENTAHGALDAGMDEDAVIIAAGPDAAAAALSNRLRRGDTVLVKGSRSMKMERVIELLRSRRLVA